MARRRPLVALYDRFLRKAPKQSRSRSVVEAVLDATGHLLPDKDHDEITLHEIAARAGVGVGSLYDYFSDRSSIFSGLAAKISEDNRRRVEERLRGARDQPLRVAIGSLVDLTFDVYLRDVRIPRTVLQIAHRTGLMPMVAENQRAFSATLASALRERTDVRTRDCDVAAYVMTNMAMGVIHAAIWSDELPFTTTQLREELTEALERYVAALPPPDAEAADPEVSRA